jgi:transposase
MTKIDYLKKMGAYNKDPKKIKYDLFKSALTFFDPLDKLQVKYEMIRAVHIDNLPVKEIPHLFGYSRETYYKTLRYFELEGCVGLLDQMQGRRQPEKLQEDIVKYIISEREKDPKNNSGYILSDKIYNQFHIRLHPRTIYKVLKK